MHVHIKLSLFHFRSFRSSARQICITSYYWVLHKHATRVASVQCIRNRNDCCSVDDLDDSYDFFNVSMCHFHASYSKAFAQYLYCSATLHHLSGDCDSLMFLHAFICIAHQVLQHCQDWFELFLSCFGAGLEVQRYATVTDCTKSTSQSLWNVQLFLRRGPAVVFIRDCNWLSFSLFHIKASLASA